MLWRPASALFHPDVVEYYDTSLRLDTEQSKKPKNRWDVMQSLSLIQHASASSWNAHAVVKLQFLFRYCYTVSQKKMCLEKTFSVVELRGI